MGEAVAHVSELALLDILLDGVERLLLGDFHLGVGPTGNLADHVEDAIGLVGKQRNVVPRRDDLSLLLSEHTVLWLTKNGN